MKMKTLYTSALALTLLGLAGQADAKNLGDGYYASGSFGHAFNPSALKDFTVKGADTIGDDGKVTVEGKSTAYGLKSSRSLNHVGASFGKHWGAFRAELEINHTRKNSGLVDRALEAAEAAAAAAKAEAETIVADNKAEGGSIEQADANPKKSKNPEKSRSPVGGETGSGEKQDPSLADNAAGDSEPKRDLKFRGKSTNILANYYYDLPLNDVFVPYVGGGVGVNLSNLDRGEAGKESKASFVYQLAAGANAFVNENVSLGVGYRFMDITSGSMKGAQHIALTSVAYHF